MDHKAEFDKIIYEDKDKENGFLMLPDLKWDGSIQTLNLLVLARKRIKSLRELNETHLPLLKNIRDAGTDIIKKKYNLPSSQLRIYLHYQPSYYHLHVHFSYLMFETPGNESFFFQCKNITNQPMLIILLPHSGIFCEKAHLLSTVISNIEISSDYYQKAVLSFVVKEDDPLCKKYQENGVLTVIDKPAEN